METNTHTAALEILHRVFRLHRLPRQPGRHRRPRGRRRRRPGADAHRRRQIPLLPDSRPAAPRLRRGHLAPDRPDAGPGGRPHPARRQGGLPQFHPGLAAGTGSGAARPLRRPGPALRRPGNACSPTAASPCWTSWKRTSAWPSSPSTKPTASPSGATTSAPNTCSSRPCTTATRMCPASPSPPPPTRPPGKKCGYAWG